MNYEEITKDDAENYSEYIDPDMAENLDRAFFRSIGATDDNDVPVGAIVYELKNSESEFDTKSRIRSLKADSEDVKNNLLEQYKSEIEEEEVEESFYESEDEVMSKKLEENGFSLEVAESLDVVLSLEDVKHLSESVKLKKLPSFITSLSETTILQYRQFTKKCLFNGKRGLLDDLAYLPKNWFEQDVSACAIEDDNITGVLLIKKAPSGKLFTLLYTAFGPDFQKTLALMMAYSAQKIVELYPEADTKVVIRRHNEMVKKLTDKFFASCKGNMVYMGNRKE